MICKMLPNFITIRHKCQRITNKWIWILCLPDLVLQFKNSWWLQEKGLIWVTLAVEPSLSFNPNTYERVTAPYTDQWLSAYFFVIVFKASQAQNIFELWNEIITLSWDCHSKPKIRDKDMKHKGSRKFWKRLNPDCQLFL